MARRDSRGTQDLFCGSTVFRRMYPDLAPGPLERSCQKRRRFQKSRSSEIPKRRQPSQIDYSEPNYEPNPPKPDLCEPEPTDSMSVVSVEKEIDTGFSIREHEFRRPQRKRIVAQKKEKEPENECEMAVHNLLVNEQLPDKEMQLKVADYIKTESAHAAIIADYKRAADLHRSYQVLCTGIENQKVEERKLQFQEETDERLRATNEKLESERQHWDLTLASFHEEQDEARERLQEAHRKEAEEFENKWGNDESLLKYTKPSPVLLQLRKMQKSMALTHQYNDADQVKEAADILAGTETATAQERAVSAMKLHYEILLDKQEREMSCFEEHRKRAELFLLSERDSALSPLEKLRDQLTNTRNRDQPTNLKPEQPVFTSTPKSKLLVTMPTKNAGTAKAMMEFRRAEGTEKLAVKGIDVRKVMGKASIHRK